MKILTIVWLILAVASVGGAEQGMFSYFEGFIKAMIFIAFTVVSYKLDIHMTKAKRKRAIRTRNSYSSRQIKSSKNNLLL